MMTTTEWREFICGGNKYRVQARYGFDLDFARRVNQAPYFSITGEVQIFRHGCVWREESFGTVHTEIATHFPELAPLIKWHLVSTEAPMHYVANGLFWFDEGKRLGWDTLDTVRYLRTSSLENLKTTIVYGGRKEDLKVDLTSKTRAQLAIWLKRRLPSLMRSFRADMVGAGVHFPGVWINAKNF